MKFQTLLELKLWCYNNGVDTKTRMMLTALWNDGKGGYEFDLSDHTPERSGGDNELEAFDMLTAREQTVASGGVPTDEATRGRSLEITRCGARPMPRRYSLQPVIPAHLERVRKVIATIRESMPPPDDEEGEPVTMADMERISAITDVQRGVPPPGSIVDAPHGYFPDGAETGRIPTSMRGIAAQLRGGREARHAGRRYFDLTEAGYKAHFTMDNESRTPHLRWKCGPITYEGDLPAQASNPDVRRRVFDALKRTMPLFIVTSDHDQYVHWCNTSGYLLNQYVHKNYPCAIHLNEARRFYGYASRETRLYFVGSYQDSPVFHDPEIQRIYQHIVASTNNELRSHVEGLIGYLPDAANSTMAGDPTSLTLGDIEAAARLLQSAPELPTIRDRMLNLVLGRGIDPAVIPTAKVDTSVSNANRRANNWRSNAGRPLTSDELDIICENAVRILLGEHPSPLAHPLDDVMAGYNRRYRSGGVAGPPPEGDQQSEIEEFIRQVGGDLQPAPSPEPEEPPSQELVDLDDVEHIPNHIIREVNQAARDGDEATYNRLMREHILPPEPDEQVEEDVEEDEAPDYPLGISDAVRAMIDAEEVEFDWNPDFDLRAEEDDAADEREEEEEDDDSEESS